jgi:hypothetical protein
MKFSAVITRVAQGNALDAAYNRVAVRSNRSRRLLRHPAPSSRPSSRRINRIIAALPGKPRYLEIGLDAGKTFETITADERVGVDPHPRFDLRRLPPGTQIRVEPSDNYFESIAATGELFDVIFLDGLHNFEQTYRDIIHAFNCLAAGGLVLVDDVVPTDEFSAMRDPKEAMRRRVKAGGTSTAWHGDVFRAIKVVFEHHPELAVRTIVGSGNPQALLWRRARSLDRLTELDARALTSYAALTYTEAFANGCPNWLQPGTEAEILAIALPACLSQRDAP